MKWMKLWRTLELEVVTELVVLDTEIEALEEKADEVRGRCANCHDYWLASAKEVRIRRDTLLRTRNEMLNLIEGSHEA